MKSLNGHIRSSLWVASVAVLGVSASARAQAPAAGIGQAAPAENSVTLRLGYGSSNNIFRTAQLEESGSYAALGAQVDYTRESSRIRFNVNGDIEYRDYHVEEIEDDAVGPLDISLAIAAVPDVFTWNFANSFRQGRVDPFAAPGPTNRQEFNVFSTGPEFNFLLGSRTALRFGTTLNKQSFDGVDALNGDRVETQLGLYRARTPTSELGIVIVNNDLDYDLIASSGYDMTAAYLNYSQSFETGEAYVSIGTNEVELGNRDRSSPYLDLGWERDVGALSRIGIYASQAFTDLPNGIQNVDPVLVGRDLIDDGFLLPDVFEQSTVRFIYNWSNGRTSFGFRARWYENRFETLTATDDDFQVFGFSVERDVSQQIQLGASVTLAETTFVQSQQQNDDSGYRLWMAYGVSSSFSVQLALERTTRGRANASGFDEDTVSLFFRYTPT